MKRLIATATVTVALVWSASPASAWHDQTHMAVSKAAGYDKWYNSAGADMAKEKAGPYGNSDSDKNGTVEMYNHWYNADAPVTPETVKAQISKYNVGTDDEAKGHNYGAIIASIRDYLAAKGGPRPKYADYKLAYCAHYCGDLSMPLHNTPYDAFNQARHTANDGIVESDVMDHIEKIQARMYDIVLREDSFEDDLAKEIALIAESSRQLGLKMRADNRDMTADEAYTMLGRSASLLRAIIRNPRLHR